MLVYPALNPVLTSKIIEVSAKGNEVMKMFCEWLVDKNLILKEATRNQETRTFCQGPDARRNTLPVNFPLFVGENAPHGSQFVDSDIESGLQIISGRIYLTNDPTYRSFSVTSAHDQCIIRCIKRSSDGAALAPGFRKLCCTYSRHDPPL